MDAQGFEASIPALQATAAPKGVARAQVGSAPDIAAVVAFLGQVAAAAAVAEDLCVMAGLSAANAAAAQRHSSCRLLEK